MLEIENAKGRVFRYPKHHGPRTVPEQHTRRAVCVVDDARHHICPDHQHVRRGPGCHQLAADRQGIGKRRAGRRQVKPPRPRRANLVLNQAGRARKQHVRRHRAHDDHIDVGRRQPGPTNRFKRRLLGEITRRHPGIHNMAGPNSGPLHNPFVRGVDQLLKVGIRQLTRWHIRRQTLDRRPTNRHGPRQLRPQHLAQNSPLPGIARSKYA